MLITDAQVHLHEPERLDRPWPKPPRTAANPAEGYTGKQFLIEMDAAGVDRAVIVPPFFTGENPAYALELHEKYPQRFAVMGRFDTDAPGGEERLAHWLEQPGMLGIRVSYLAMPRREQIDDGSLEWFYSACERYGIPLMMLFSGMAEKARPIIERHPGLTVILDHIALPLQDGIKAFDALSHVLPLASHPNVYVKVSSVPNFSAEPYPHRDVFPYMRQLYDTFGPQRLFWGADFTRLAGTYVECVDMFRKDIEWLSAEDREWILGRALAECLHWPEA